MKPKNFPGRKLKRQITALSKLSKYHPARDNTHRKIKNADPDLIRNIRTKKKRG